MGSLKEVAYCRENLPLIVLRKINAMFTESQMVDLAKMLLAGHLMNLTDNAGFSPTIYYIQS